MYLCTFGFSVWIFILFVFITLYLHIFFMIWFRSSVFLLFISMRRYAALDLPPVCHWTILPIDNYSIYLYLKTWKRKKKLWYVDIKYLLCVKFATTRTTIKEKYPNKKCAATNPSKQHTHTIEEKFGFISFRFVFVLLNLFLLKMW